MPLPETGTGLLLPSVAVNVSVVTFDEVYPIANVAYVVVARQLGCDFRAAVNVGTGAALGVTVGVGVAVGVALGVARGVGFDEVLGAALDRLVGADTGVGVL